MPKQSAERLSDIIGEIYDCAIDPSLWPSAIAAIGSATGCFAGAIAVTDLEKSGVRLMQYWNYDPATLSRAAQYSDELAGLWRYFPDRRPLDEPISSRRVIPRDVYENSRYYNEWGRPQGIVDSLHLVLMRNSCRAGEFGLSRHESVGLSATSMWRSPGHVSSGRCARRDIPTRRRLPRG